MNLIMRGHQKCQGYKSQRRLRNNSKLKEIGKIRQLIGMCDSELCVVGLLLLFVFLYVFCLSLLV